MNCSKRQSQRKIPSPTKWRIMLSRQSRIFLTEDSALESISDPMRQYSFTKKKLHKVSIWRSVRNLLMGSCTSSSAYWCWEQGCNTIYAEYLKPQIEFSKSCFNGTRTLIFSSYIQNVTQIGCVFLQKHRPWPKKKTDFSRLKKVSPTAKKYHLKKMCIFFKSHHKIHLIIIMTTVFS